MTLQSCDIADFYHQLAMLVKSDMPLPDSIRQLGNSFHKRQFQSVLEQLSRETANGESLATAMERHPQFFTPFHIQLIATGEKSGALPEILFEVARVSRLNQQLINRTRDVMVYPIFTIVFTCLLFSVLLQHAVPGIQEIYREMAMDMKIPILTQIVFTLSDWVTSIPLLIYTGLAGVIAAIIWLFSGRFHADRMFIRVLNLFPGTGQFLKQADLSRASAVLASYLSRDIPTHIALGQTAELVEGHSLRRRLQEWAELTSQGKTWKNIFEAPGHGGDPLLALTVRHSTEKGIGTELRGLAELYAERAENARSKVIAMWQFILVLMMAGVAGTIIMALFLPLLNLVDHVSK